MKRLIQQFDNLQSNHLNDLMIIMAKNVEDSLLDCGAIPGEDYTLLDLYKLASPLVTDCFSSQEIQFTQQWRDQ